MAISDVRVQDAAYVSFLGGVDSNLHPSLLQPDQLAWATNCSTRGGSLGPRPGFLKRPLTYQEASDETSFQDATTKFQGAGYYRASRGNSEIVVAVGGKLFAIDPVGDYQVRDITPSSGALSPNNSIVHINQAEEWAIIQDGQDAPVYYNKAGSRRAESLVDELPAGSVSTYANGRVWVGRKSEYAAGDLVGSSSGDPEINRRDAVLKFTENDYLNEGGAFATPANSGDITALEVVGALDTATGEGEVVVFTRDSVFATSVPTDRTQWKNLSYPVQRLVASKGAVGPFSPVNVNGDLYYRAPDGIRSLVFARRDFADPGMTPISNEVKRALAKDDPHLLKHSSATLYDNRLLHSCIGRRTSRGVVHRALVSLNFDTISNMRAKAPPAYEGVWTGLDMFHIVSGDFGGQERCFVFSLEGTQIELWEIDPESYQDYNGTTYKPIEWFCETREISFTSPFEMVRMDRVESWMREVKGEVAFTLYVRPDDSPVWNQWASWKEDAKVELCDSDAETCLPLRSYRPSYRPRRSIANPPQTSENLAPSKPTNDGYTFQFRLAGTGFAKVDRLRFFARQDNEDVYGAAPPATATQTQEYGCPLEEFPEIS